MDNFIDKGAPKIDKFRGRGFAAISYKQNRIVNIHPFNKVESGFT